jgi:hypothetical protein
MCRRALGWMRCFSELLGNRLVTSKTDAVDEFRTWVLEAYRPLLEQGFAETAPRSAVHANPFSVRIANSTTVIEVEGVHYGAAAWTKLFRRPDVDLDQYGLPIGELLAMRVLERMSKKHAAEGQRAQLFRDAADLFQHAQDVLSGDFSALDAISQKQAQLEQERRARAPTPQQRAANIACCSRSLVSAPVRSSLIHWADDR